MSTIDYYNANAQSFAEGTLTADMTALYGFFEKYLEKGAAILDLGCGAGRDAKYFLDKGYAVTAVDGSAELCRIAAEHAGIPVRCMLFEELDYDRQFDGIWACASLLHVEKEKLPELLAKIRDALKPGGVLYCSFKYGDFCGERNGRYFTNLDENGLEELIGGIAGLSLLEIKITGDVREGRRDELWINAVAVRSAG